MQGRFHPLGLRRGPRAVSPAISPASRKAPSAIVQGRKGAKAGGRWGEGGLDCQGQTLRVKQDWSWKGKNQETQNIFVIVCSLGRDSGFLFRVQPCLTPLIQFALRLPHSSTSISSLVSVKIMYNTSTSHISTSAQVLL